MKNVKLNTFKNPENMKGAQHKDEHNKNSCKSNLLKNIKNEALYFKNSCII